MLRRVALLGVLATAAPTFQGCVSEPPLDVAPDVDLSRFQGKWYEIARLPRITETDCYGTTAFYTAGSGGGLQLVHQCNVGSTTGPLNTISMVATVPNASVPAKLALSVGGYSGDYWILEVGPSYEYAVIGHPSRSYFWILSRAPTLDPATLQGVLGRAESGHFDTSQLEFTPQPPAGDRVSSDAPIGAVPPAMSTGCGISPATGRNTAVFWFGMVIVAGIRRVRRRTS
ncbi:MAG: lipocalin family protein [Polyangiaceae bacterium]|jgi:apolipoprotein D and lipocalin family protein